MIDERAIYREVGALARLDLAGLRDVWRKRYGEPPKMRSKDLLARMLAWRIQADVFGGFDERTERMLTSDGPPPVELEPGMRLAREWQGRRYEVEIVPNGFLYADKAYASLSAVAREITGTRWNGLRFFGLRDQA